MKLLKLITRYPGAIPSILNNPHDPNQPLTVKKREREREKDRYHYCYHYYRRLFAFHVAHVRVIDFVRLRAKRNLSPDPRDRKLMTANHRGDLSIPIHRPDGAWSTIPLHISPVFRGLARPPRRSIVALPLWYSTNRFHARSASVTLPGREHCGSDALMAHRERVHISFRIHSSARCATSSQRIALFDW